MKSWVRKTLSVGVLAAGALLFAPGAAHADIHADTHDNNGILNGTQFVAPINIPLSIVGNAIGVAGEANSAGAVQNWTESGWGGTSLKSHDNNGIANGTQAYLPINAPINVVGNALGVLGEANAAGSAVNGRSTESTTIAGKGHKNRHWSPTLDSHGNNGILNGTQIYSPVDIPINICGNSLGLLGEASAQAVCGNVGGGAWGRSTESAHVGGPTTHDNNGILNGTQVYAPINLPVNLAGNAVGILGEGNAAAQVVNESGHLPGAGLDSHDNNGIGNGTQIALPINAPVNVCGNALGILGAAQAQAACGNLVGGGGLQGDHGNQGGKGHGHHPGGNAGTNGGDDYMGAGGAQGNGDDYMGAGGAQGNGDDNGYGGQDPAGYDSSTSARPAAKSATEASAVDGLTKSAGGVGSVGLGGLDLLNTLR